MGNFRTPFSPDTIYHVVHHGVSKENIFLKEENYGYFLLKYKQYINPIAKTFAYCLMPNHFHIGLKINNLYDLKVAFATHAGIRKYENVTYSSEQIEQLVAAINEVDIPNLISTQFGHFLNAYAKSINKQENRRGSLFLEAIYRERVESAAYYKNMVRYIHNNPVRHGFVERATDWSYSSIHAFNSLKFSLLERGEVMDWFGGAEAFWDFHALGNESDVFELFDI